jgi:EAL domain-containing protein (putative c-di-GMP-specific phosphodiesterase class I)
MIADTLGRKVVAEGVETATQLEETRSLHCTVGQGWLFSRPLTVEDATALLSSGRGLLEQHQAEVLPFRRSAG